MFFASRRASIRQFEDLREDFTSPARSPTFVLACRGKFRQYSGHLKEGEIQRGRSIDLRNTLSGVFQSSPQIETREICSI